MTSAYENAMSDQQANNYTQQYPVVTHEIIETPFQVAMNCLHVPEQADYICWNCTIKIIDKAESAEARVRELEAANAELQRQLEQARNTIIELQDLCPRMSEDDPIAPAIADCLSRYKKAAQS